MSDSSNSFLEKTNVYELNALDVTTQKETTWENILEYFESYIKPYVPYKDEPTYKAMISFIIKYYADQIYNVQPDIFKDMFEKQTIRSELIDLLLVSIGLPENVIQTITTTSKFTILKSFSDFERYQGTVKFFRSIGGAFTDTVSFYELYIDFDKDFVNPLGEYLIFVDKDNIFPGSYFLISSRDTNYYVWFDYEDTSEDPLLQGKTGIRIYYDRNSSSEDIAQSIIHGLNETDEFYVNVNASDIIQVQLQKHGAAAGNPSGGTTQLDIRTVTEGKESGAWILRPRPIFIHKRMEQLTETFSYQAAYNKIPTLLVPEAQLEEMKKNDELILPTKSNIILMDYTQTIDASYFNTLEFTVLMEYIGDYSFSVYLTGSDETTAITYNTAIFTWFYLLAKYYGVTLEGVSIAHHIVMGTNKITDLTLEDLPRVEQEYKDIQTREQLIDFYNTYFRDQFGRYYEAEKPTIEVMSETLRKLDSSFWQYIEDRIAMAEDQEQDIRFLLDEIYASLILSFNQYRENAILYERLPILLQFVTQVTTNIKSTDSYKIIYNLKPFHTELLDLAHNKIVVEDKFNALLLSDEKQILFNLALADLLHMADEAIFTFSPKADGDSLSLNDYAVPLWRVRYTESIEPKDKFDGERDPYDKDYSKMSVLKTAAEILHLSDQTSCTFTPKEKESILSLVDALNPHGNYVQTTYPWVDDKINKKYLRTILTFLQFMGHLDFHYTPPKNTDVIPITDHSANYFNFSKESNKIVKDQSFSTTKKTILEDTPYISDKMAFRFNVKDDQFDIYDNIADSFSFSKNSDITLTDEIRIKQTRSRNNV